MNRRLPWDRLGIWWAFSCLWLTHKDTPDKLRGLWRKLSRGALHFSHRQEFEGTLRRKVPRVHGEHHSVLKYLLWNDNLEPAEQCAFFLQDSQRMRSGGQGRCDAKSPGLQEFGRTRKHPGRSEGAFWQEDPRSFQSYEAAVWWKGSTWKILSYHWVKREIRWVDQENKGRDLEARREVLLNLGQDEQDYSGSKGRSWCFKADPGHCWLVHESWLAYS